VKPDYKQAKYFNLEDWGEFIIATFMATPLRVSAVLLFFGFLAAACCICCLEFS